MMRNMIAGCSVAYGCAVLLSGTLRGPGRGARGNTWPARVRPRRIGDESSPHLKKKSRPRPRLTAVAKILTELSGSSTDTPAFSLGTARRSTLNTAAPGAIDWLRNKHGVNSLSDAASRLSLWEEGQERIESEGDPTRPQALSDYFEIAALRRRVAMSNPLLDFDTLLFVGRGNYYGDDPTGQHQLSGPMAFCNRVGGGLYVVKNFKTNAEVIDVLEHSVVENGTYRGWTAFGKGVVLFTGTVL